jgi:REP element-mobilizing transposase RayT
MPNHIHGILIITEISENAIQNQQDMTVKSPDQTRFQHQGKASLSSIIGSYKSSVSYHAHRLGHSFEWQKRFHDHVIRDEKSFCLIQNYINSNPANWKEDCFFM